MPCRGVTILRIHRLLTLHYVFGFPLLGPLALKLGSTGYRFLRYYTVDPEYVRAGPPQPLLRALAPFLVLSTVAVFATGVALAFVRPADASVLVMLHKASFMLWFWCTTIHVLAHFRRSVQHTASDLLGRGVGVRSRRTRVVLAGASAVVGLIIAVPANGWAHPWVAHQARLGGH